MTRTLIEAGILFLDPGHLNSVGRIVLRIRIGTLFSQFSAGELVIYRHSGSPRRLDDPIVCAQLIPRSMVVARR